MSRCPLILCHSEVKHEENAIIPHPGTLPGDAGQSPHLCCGEERVQRLLDHLRRLDAWGTLSSSKIIDKWADKYGIKINVVQLNDYIESINQYTAGQFDGCTMTNMDALTIPAAGGVDTTALILGSYSEGNDGVVMKGEGKTLNDLKG